MVTRYNKLVRDKVLKLLTAQGYSYECDKYISHKSYRKALADVLEDDLRFFLDTGIKENQVDRLADMLEVIYALANDCEINKKALELARANKEKEKGKYREKIKLISVDDKKDEDEV